MALSASVYQALLQPALKAGLQAAAPINDANTLASVIAQAVASTLFPYLTANAVVAGIATGALGGGPGVPVVGSIT